MSQKLNKQSAELKQRLLDYMRGRNFLTVPQATKWQNDQAFFDLLRDGWSMDDALDVKHIYLSDFEIMKILA